MNPLNTNIINPKPCNYNCGNKIYWNTPENVYFEVFNGNRHQCPKRSNINKKSSTTETSSVITNKPKYYSNYNKFSNKQPKPKMSNSLELLQGHFEDIQKKYEMLSDIVSETNGRVHGSQSHIIVNNANVISLIIYYKVPEGKRDDIK